MDHFGGEQWGKQWGEPESSESPKSSESKQCGEYRQFVGEHRARSLATFLARPDETTAGQGNEGIEGIEGNEGIEGIEAGRYFV